MLKKVSSQKNIRKQEGKVEDIYGAHFRYQDLCSRLLKVQKERRRSEIKSSGATLQSFDSAKKLRNCSSKGKKTKVQDNKDCSLQPEKKVLKNSSVKKLKMKFKSEIFKTFSPRETALKVILKSKSKKKREKTDPAKVTKKKVQSNNKTDKVNTKFSA